MQQFFLRRLRAIRVYELIAFVIGFTLMAYELVASRILAPTIGSSMYVWTSVIGVIIAALSLGYALGGIIADRRVQPLDVVWLLLASAFAVITTLVLAPGVLSLMATTVPDVRLQGLCASLILFLPTSFLMGMISPYLARLRMVSVATSGTAVASLSALNAIGGIAGTFCTGFIFFGYIGSKETLVLLGVALVAASWLITPKTYMARRVAATVCVLLLGVLTSLTKGPAQVLASVDTPTMTYRVVTARLDNQPIRVLVTGPGSMQSGVFPTKPDLVFRYAQQMARLIEHAPKKDRILILGGGAFTLPQYLATHYPSSKVDVVEIDPHLLDIAKQYFNYVSPANVNVIFQDARAFLNTNANQYDIILVDVYSDLSVPFSASTVEYTQRLRQSLAPGGVVMANIIGADSPGCHDFLGAVHASYSKMLPAHKAYYVKDPTLQAYQNIVVAYSVNPLAWLSNDYAATAPLPSGQLLTDNFAPVERFKQSCGG